jgi:hypothetical protein
MSSPPAFVCPVLPPAPASVLQPRASDFGSRMQNFLFEPQTKPTK